MSSQRLLRETALLVCAALTACAGVAPPAAAPNEAQAPPTPEASYDKLLRDQAASALAQQHLADAAIDFELLTVLHPDDPELGRRLAEVRGKIAEGVAARMPRAAQAAQRGDLDRASQLYLSVLALDPTQMGAADALRSIERERNKRSYLGKYSSVTLTRHAIAEAEMSPELAAAGSNELEHAALLARDGQFDDAIDLLRARLEVDRQDSAARRLLAEVYYRQAEALLPRDRQQAYAALENSARAYPADGRAARRLKALRQPQRVAARPAPIASAPPGAIVPTSTR